MDVQGIISGLEQSGGIGAAAANAGASPEDTRGILQGVLEHAESGGELQGIADSVAQRAGVDPALVNQVLPHILPLLQSHLASSPQAAQGGLGGLMGAMSGMFGGVRA